METERDQVRTLLSNDKESRTRVDNMTSLLAQKTKDVESLEQALNTLKQDANNQLQHTVSWLSRRLFVRDIFSDFNKIYLFVYSFTLFAVIRTPGAYKII